MFKDLMQAIFTEEVEPEEEVNEPVQKEETPVSNVQVQQPQESTFVEPQIHLEPQTEDVQIASFGQIPASTEPKNTIFTGLDVDSVASEEPRPRKKMYHFDRSKTKKVRRTQEDLEYTPIISPIFGNMEESKKDTSKVHNAIDLSKPEQLEDYMTVLSPMYGDRPGVTPVVQNIPKMEPAQKEAKNKDRGYSLDSMLEKPEKKENKQATLFSKD